MVLSVLGTTSVFSVLSGCASRGAPSQVAANEVGIRPGPESAVTGEGRVGMTPSPLRGSAQALAADPGFARHLLVRLGYGPRPGELEHLLAIGPQAWLDAQLDPASIAQPAALERALAERATLRTPHPETLAAFARLQREALASGVDQARREEARRELAALVRRVQGEARQARLLRAAYGERVLEEALVEFWFDRFNVFGGKQTVRATVGAYELEAIRPHVLGRFRDLLGATARHPAMLDYLDNAQSVRAGFRVPRGVALPEGVAVPRGVNENYARELLELHTLGVDGGYGQHDVAELARVFTGWSFDRRDPSGPTAFRFYPNRHDPAPKTLLGRPVPGAGVEQGERALDALARHPSTARHVARALAVAFVADVPPPTLVDRLAARFAATDGDLREVMRALAASPEFADPAVRGAKFKTPYRYVVSVERAIGAAPGDVVPLALACARMGMPIYGCPTPDGWKDLRETWATPDGLRQRAEFALAAARGAGRAGLAPGELPEPVASALGPQTRRALDGVPPAERLALALASPDFMRR
jgi:uncharacterized protein (DUF1800 family)